MIHELLGLNNGRVMLPDTPDGEVTMSARDDVFFDENKYQNFGDLGGEIRDLMQKFASEHRVRTDVKSLDDMRTFMDKYPAFRAQSSRVSKHVTITSELSRLVETCNLFDISALEQDLACQDDHNKQYRELVDMMGSDISFVDKLRLGLLYTLRFETSADLPRLKALMIEGGVPKPQVDLIDKLILYAGQAQRPPGLFTEHKGLFGRIKKNLHVGVAGVKNVYTQHTPLMAKVVDSLFKGNINEMQYPLLGEIGGNKGGRNNETGAEDRRGGRGGNNNGTPCPNVVVWMMGGTTYEESAHVHALNNSGDGVKILLGGSCVHNSTSFLREVSVAPIR
mmetsp:Transcript_4617/g.5933  ORF Transcript_4617/g.5933 Transcript_4617/m.5933 type:complete len:336 (-) Transcript_4617:131-1138(-)